MSNKRYKLLKDLPDAPAKTVFTFTGDRDNGGYLGLGKFGEIWYRQDIVEQNTQWFEEVKPERIVVRQIGRVPPEGGYYFNLSKEILPHEHDGTMLAIKSAIENLLNVEGIWEVHQQALEQMSKMYTQEQYNKAIEDAFNMAREKADPVPEPPRIRDYFRYPTFQDYLKSLQP